MQPWRDILAALPRLGWVHEPSPVEARPDEARALGVDGLWLKRDDRLGLAHGLHGGTKVRKLDVLLATAPWRDAPGWASVGAIGSGQLVALSAAARVLGRRLRAHLFWEPPLPGLLENLAYVASGPGELRYVDTRIGLALRHPGALVSKRIGDWAVVPPGASALEGTLGVVLGLLELEGQIAAGLCPAPAHVFVPLGSGGTAAGLWAGLALVGWSGCTLHAVATVERPYALRGALEAKARAVLRRLGAGDAVLPPMVIDRGRLGPGYGVATSASLDQAARFGAAGVPLEPIYSGKAMAGLAAVAGGLRGPVLFWVTPRAAAPLPVAPDWRAHLPPRLARRLLAAEAGRLPARRRLLWGLAGAAVAVTAWRFTGYPEPPSGLVHLSGWAAGALGAVAEAVLLPQPSREEVADLLGRVDRFLATQPFSIRAQVLGAISLVEQGGGLWARHLVRVSRLPVAERVRVLDALVDQGGLVAEAGRAVRDLCMLGHYQRPSTWAALGYGGPWVGEAPRIDPYQAFETQAPPPGFEGPS